MMTPETCSSSPGRLSLTLTSVTVAHAGCRITSKIAVPRGQQLPPEGLLPASPVHFCSGSQGFVWFGSLLSPALFSNSLSLNTPVLSSHLSATIGGVALASSRPANPGRCNEMCSGDLSHGNLIILDSLIVLSSEDLKDTDKH